MMKAKGSKGKTGARQTGKPSSAPLDSKPCGSTKTSVPASSQCKKPKGTKAT